MNSTTRSYTQTKTNHSDQTHTEAFIANVRDCMLTLETTNIRIKAHAFQSMINDETQKTKETVQSLCSNPMAYTHFHPKRQIPPFVYTVNDEKVHRYLSYIREWKGLSCSAQIPQVEKKYIHKAKNWLNGRRPTVYGSTLYVDMLRAAETYAMKVSRICFDDAELADLYYHALFSAYLNKVMLQTIRLSKSVKNTKLVAEHAIKSKCETKLLLQNACMHGQSSTFPAHRTEAIRFFKKQSMSTLTMLQRKMNGRRCRDREDRMEVDAVVTKLSQSCTNINEFVVMDRENQRVYIDSSQFGVILEFVTRNQQRLVANQHSISILSQEVQRLESNVCFLEMFGKIKDHSPLQMKSGTACRGDVQSAAN